MDLLSQRYASPFLILDDFIRLKQLHSFVNTVFGEITKEKVHKARWEYYIHKVWDNMTFEEYVNLCENEQKKSVSKEDIVSVLHKSNNILSGFNPE